MKVLICGGQNISDKNFVFSYLENLHIKRNIQQIVCSDILGANLLASQWAEEKKIDYSIYQPNAAKDGIAANIVKNKLIFETEKNFSMILSFPGDNNLIGMTSTIKKDNMPVVKVFYPGDKRN